MDRLVVIVLFAVQHKDQISVGLLPKRSVAFSKAIMKDNKHLSL